LDARPRAGTAGTREWLAAARLACPRGARVARSVPGLQGLRVRLPDRRGHGNVQSRGAASGLPGAPAAGLALRARLAAALGPAGRPRAPPRGQADGGAGGGRGLAAVGKRLAGVDPRRELPPFAPQTFRQWFASHPAPPGDPVLLWVDTFTNHFTPAAGIAAVQVLEAAGVSGRIHGPPLCCGLTWISTGQLDSARRILRRSVRALAGPARVGVPIVGLEPSCTAVFRGDAAALLGPAPAVSAVAQATRTLAELLGPRQGWEPPRPGGPRVVAQPHCHQHAVMGGEADRELLTSAGAAVRAVGGCCGLAGNFGAERGHYDLSVAIAGSALLPAVDAAGDGSVLLADGFSCRTQLSQLTGRRGLHLAELLARRELACHVPLRALPWLARGRGPVTGAAGSDGTRAEHQQRLEPRREGGGGTPGSDQRRRAAGRPAVLGASAR